MSWCVPSLASPNLVFSCPVVYHRHAHPQQHIILLSFCHRCVMVRKESIHWIWCLLTGWEGKPLYSSLLLPFLLSSSCPHSLCLSSSLFCLLFTPSFLLLSIIFSYLPSSSLLNFPFYSLLVTSVCPLFLSSILLPFLFVTLFYVRTTSHFTSQWLQSDLMFKLI